VIFSKNFKKKQFFLFFFVFIIRYVCSKAIDRDSMLLGGEDEIVEIDESMFQRVKHHRGKDLKRKQLWVFGLKLRSNKKGLLIVVRARNAATLLKIIYAHCKPNTIIHSDLWKSYKHLSKFNKNFKHLTVNHSLHFVDPETHVHTNGIESIWRGKTKDKANGRCETWLHTTVLRRIYVAVE
jgi:transposase-like protein